MTMPKGISPDEKPEVIRRRPRRAKTSEYKGKTPIEILHLAKWGKRTKQDIDASEAAEHIRHAVYLKLPVNPELRRKLLLNEQIPDNFKTIADISGASDDYIRRASENAWRYIIRIFGAAYETGNGAILRRIAAAVENRPKVAHQAMHEIALSKVVADGNGEPMPDIPTLLKGMKNGIDADRSTVSRLREIVTGQGEKPGRPKRKANIVQT